MSYKSPTEKRGLFNQLYTAGDSGVGIQVREGRGLWQVLLFGGAATALLGAKIEFMGFALVTYAITGVCASLE